MEQVCLGETPCEILVKKTKQLSRVSHQDLIQAESLQLFHWKGNSFAYKKPPNKTSYSHVKVLSQVQKLCSSQDSSLPQTHI